MRKINIDKYSAKASIYTGSGIYCNKWSIENPGNNKGRTVYTIQYTVYYTIVEVKLHNSDYS